MSIIQDFSPILNIVLTVLLAVGGFLAFRKGYSKETEDAMERLNKTLDGEIQVLRRRVDDLERERATQDRVIATIRYALKQYGLRVTIAGDFVTLNDTSGKSKSTRIQPAAPVQPLAPTLSDDDDAAN